MCKMLIVAKAHNAKRLGGYQSGDVVGVLPDEHVFSPLEMSDPFRVIHIPGLPIKAMHAYLLGSARHRRGMRFDLSGALGGLVRAATGVIELRKAAAFELLQSTVTYGD